MLIISLYLKSILFLLISKIQQDFNPAWLKNILETGFKSGSVLNCSKRAQKFPFEKWHFIYKNHCSNNVTSWEAQAEDDGAQFACRWWTSEVVLRDEPGWINFQSLIFINSSFRKKYKEVTQLPSELNLWVAALQSQVHNAILIDQEGTHTFSKRWKSRWA